MSEKLFDIVRIPERRGFPVAVAAKYLGIHPQTLRRYCDLGEIVCRRIGKHRVFFKEDLDAWLESQPKWVKSVPGISAGR